MTNEQFEIIDRHLGSIALSLKVLAERPEGTPPPADASKSSASSHTGWRATVIPFGKQKGERLGDIGEKSLRWWIENYQPKGFTGRDGNERPPSASDLALRKALDEAAKELGTPVPPPDHPTDSRPADGARAPFQNNGGGKPAPAPQQDTPDEDVPF